MPSGPLLPLFPLEVVLLPQEALPLHIFEERYKLMIGEAAEGRLEFGIVLVKEQAMASAGCTALVEKVLRRYPDGRLDILTRGQRRYQILHVDEQKPYLRAAIEFFDDEDDQTPSSEAALKLAGLVEEALGLTSETASLRAEEPKGAFRIAGLLPLDLDLKQRLLTTRSEAGRVALLIQSLEQLLPGWRRARRARRSAGGNGRGQ